MCDSRLSDIAVLSIESSRAESLSLDAFVDEFEASEQKASSALVVILNLFFNAFMFYDILMIYLT